jgi:GT2 family glycosyltransferase/glycosyltransferase involved in cell wall biosynthesis
MTEMKFEDIAAVVVHHRSYETLAATIAKLLADGVSPSKVLVVDNSEEPANEGRLKSSLPEGVELVFCPNSGYGAAVNLGVAWHAKNTNDAEYLLVSTHEALPEEGALRQLKSALDLNASAGVVGPTLVTGADSELVWSLGGYFSKHLGLPRHHAHNSPRSRVDAYERREVSWLDGAFLLFRKDVIEQHPIDEAFFLYMEETDHQQSLRRHGWKVIHEPAAVVWQSSGGTPTFYQTRNIQLFQAKNGSWLQRTASAPYIVARAIARDLVKGRGVSEWPQLIAGWRAGRSLTPQSATDSAQKIVIVNPLGGALAHYTKALTEILRASGAEVEVQSIGEPSLSGSGRLRWLIEYQRLLRRASRTRHEASRTLVTWPVGGFLDLLLAKVLCGRTAAIVYHDPKPLVRAIGSGRLVARLVSAIPNLPQVIVHSEAAADAMREIGLGSSLEILAHPMLRPNAGREASIERQRQRSVVRVLGQFKQDRDVEALQTIASRLGPEYTLEIVGRGWPDVDGWCVDSRFVSEREMDDLVKTSDAIVIPYKRFYQSGIAIRALEAGTPIVGRAASSLAELYGAGSSLLVVDDPDAQTAGVEPWSQAVRHAVTNGGAEAREAGNDFFDKAVSGWRSWISKEASEMTRK